MRHKFILLLSIILSLHCFLLEMQAQKPIKNEKHRGFSKKNTKPEQTVKPEEKNLRPASTEMSFSFSKPKAQKNLPDSVKKKVEKMQFVVLKKDKQKQDSIKKAQIEIAKVLAKYPGLPKNATFCGERVPIENVTVAERFYGIYQRYAGARGLLSYYSKIGNRYKKELQQAMKRNGLPNDLFYLVCAESGFANLTSSKGAKGFFQFMEQTARDYGLEVSYTVDERLHPQKSADAACRFLKDLYRGLGRWALAAAAYNMGQGALEATAATQGTRDYFRLNLNPETAEYVYRILSIKLLMENMGAKGGAQPIPHIVEKITYHIHDLHAFASDCDVDYATLKILNPWLVQDKLWVQEGKTYEIWLPKYSNQVISADELIPIPFVNPNGPISREQIRDSIKQALSML